MLIIRNITKRVGHKKWNVSMTDSISLKMSAVPKRTILPFLLDMKGNKNTKLLIMNHKTTEAEAIQIIGTTALTIPKATKLSTQPQIATDHLSLTLFTTIMIILSRSVAKKCFRPLCQVITHCETSSLTSWRTTSARR